MFPDIDRRAVVWGPNFGGALFHPNGTGGDNGGAKAKADFNALTKAFSGGDNGIGAPQSPDATDMALKARMLARQQSLFGLNRGMESSFLSGPTGFKATGGSGVTYGAPSTNGLGPGGTTGSGNGGTGGT